MDIAAIQQDTPKASRHWSLPAALCGVAPTHPAPPRLALWPPFCPPLKPRNPPPTPRKQKIDFDRELTTVAVSNMATGAAGCGYTGSYIFRQAPSAQQGFVWGAAIGAVEPQCVWLAAAIPETLTPPRHLPRPGPVLPHSPVQPDHLYDAGGRLLALEWRCGGRLGGHHVCAAVCGCVGGRGAGRWQPVGWQGARREREAESFPKLQHVCTRPLQSSSTCQTSSTAACCCGSALRSGAALAGLHCGWWWDRVAPCVCLPAPQKQLRTFA